LWLPKLRSLNLSGNVLTRIPVAVLGLKHLSDLDISKNDISSLQPHIGCILSLTHLNIEGNPQRGVRPGVVEMGTPACLGFLRSRVAVGDEKKYVSMFAVEEEEIIAPQPVNSAHAQQQQFYQQKPESITSQVMTMKQQHPVAHSSTSSSAGMTGDYYQMVRRIEELQNELQSGGGSVAQIQASKRELLLLRAAEARAKQQNSGF
jgi:hypothetical protein